MFLSLFDDGEGMRRVRMSLFLMSIFALVQFSKGLGNYHQYGILNLNTITYL